MSAEYEYENPNVINPQLNCSICQGPFNDPCCTPCGETYCRKCISLCLQTQNDSCPHCRQIISINSLKRVPRRFQNMLDRLVVRCKLCGQGNLTRVDFSDHIQEVCPNAIISCPSLSTECLWRGQRNQINIHLRDCRFLPMRSVITQIIVENQQLKDQVDLLRNQLTERQNEKQQLRDQVDLLKNQLTEQQNEKQQLRDQVDLLRNQSTEQENEKQKLEQWTEKQTIELSQQKIELKQLKKQTIEQETEIMAHQKENQSLQKEVARLEILCAKRNRTCCRRLLPCCLQPA